MKSSSESLSETDNEVNVTALQAKKNITTPFAKAGSVLAA